MRTVSAGPSTGSSTGSEMQILLATYQGGIAGSTFSVSYLAGGLAARGHRVTLVTRLGTMYKELLKDTPVRVEYLPMKDRFDRRSTRRLCSIIERDRIQVVNSQASIDRYLTIWAKKLMGRNAALIHTRRQTPKPSAAKLQGAFYTWGTDGIIAVSNGLKEELIRRMGIPEDHITVIRNGTPRQKYVNVMQADLSELRKRLGIHECDFVIGCISRHKMQEQLIEAMKAIKDFRANVILAGITEDELELPSEEWPDHHRIICTGRLDPEDALRMHRLLDIHVLPSVTEGLSQSLLESMFLGVPVIATNAAGNTDLIEDGMTGYLFDREDTYMLTKRIRELHDSPERGRRLAERARQTVENDYGMERVIDQYEDYFRSMIRE